MIRKPNVVVISPFLLSLHCFLPPPFFFSFLPSLVSVVFVNSVPGESRKIGQEQEVEEGSFCFCWFGLFTKSLWLAPTHTYITHTSAEEGKLFLKTLSQSSIFGKSKDTKIQM